MKTAQIPVIGGSYKYKAREVSSQTCENLYTENVEDAQGKQRQILISTHGTEVFSQFAASGACRGLYRTTTGPTGAETLVGVFGKEVYRLVVGESPVKIGEVNTAGATVSIADNGVQCVIADGTALHSFGVKEPTASVAQTWQLVNLTFPVVGEPPLVIRPRFVVCIGHRFVIDRNGSGEFYYSGLLSTDFSAADYYTAESSADEITALTASEGALFVFGSQSCELWQLNAGESEYDVFSFVGGSSSAYGCKQYTSVATSNGSVFFVGSSELGREGVFVWTKSGLPQRISTNAIEERLKGKSVYAGFCWYEQGHNFYAVSLADTTLVYDFSTQLWHERRERLADGTDTKWECAFSAVFLDKVLFGSEDGAVLSLGGWRTYKGTQLVRKRTTSTIWDNNFCMSLRQLLLDCEVGSTPELVGQGRNPQAMLKVSTDGGFTFYDCGWASLGRQGQFWRIAQWWNLGQGDSFIFEFSFSDPAPIHLFGMRVGYTTSTRL